MLKFGDIAMLEMSKPKTLSELMVADTEAVYTPEELAQILDCSHRTLERWYKLGTGPARFKVGKRAYYRASTVRDWMISQERSQMEGQSDES